MYLVIYKGRYGLCVQDYAQTRGEAERMADKFSKIIKTNDSATYHVCKINWNDINLEELMENEG